MPSPPPKTLSQHASAARAAWYAGVLVALIAIAGAGWLFVQRATEYGEVQERGDLAAVAAAAAAAIDPQDIARLHASAADEGSPALADMHAQLRRIRDAIPHARFVYLVTLRGGQVLFLADAELPTSQDYSPPGQVYTEAPAGFMQVFASQRPQAHGPYRDRWGEWLTGLASVPQADGDTPRAVLGIDVSSEHYLKEVASYRSFALAIIALLAIVLSLCAAVVLMQRRFNARLQKDLAMLQQAQRRLQLSDAVIENMAEGLMIIDPDLQIETVNPAFEKITGYPPDEAAGRSPKLLFSGKHDDTFFDIMHKYVDTEGNWRGEIWNRRRNGELYPQRTSISALRDADGSILHYAALFSDDTAQNQLEAKLRELSSVDGLTGIANRRSFDELLGREWARALREGGALALVMADIDFFKAYNDHYGHLAGDRCLQQVAGAFSNAACRGSDRACRYGGEEFAVILPGADAAAADSMGEKLRAAVESLAIPHERSTASKVVTVSVGVAVIMPMSPTGEAALIEAADHAMYQAKHGGRNRVVHAATPETPTSPEPTS